MLGKKEVILLILVLLACVSLFFTGESTRKPMEINASNQLEVSPPRAANGSIFFQIFFYNAGNTGRFSPDIFCEENKFYISTDSRSIGQNRSDDFLVEVNVNELEDECTIAMLDQDQITVVSKRFNFDYRKNNEKRDLLVNLLVSTCLLFCCLIYCWYYIMSGRYLTLKWKVLFGMVLVMMVVSLILIILSQFLILS